MFVVYHTRAEFAIRFIHLLLFLSRHWLLETFFHNDFHIGPSYNPTISFIINIVHMAHSGLSIHRSLKTNAKTIALTSALTLTGMYTRAVFLTVITVTFREVFRLINVFYKCDFECFCCSTILSFLVYVCCAAFLSNMWIIITIICIDFVFTLYLSITCAILHKTVITNAEAGSRRHGMELLPLWLCQRLFVCQWFDFNRLAGTRVLTVGCTHATDQ